MTSLIHAITAMWLSTSSLDSEAPKTSVMSVYERTEEISQPVEMTIEDIIYVEGEKAGLSTKEMHRFLKIAQCESHLNPKAVSRTKDYGLFQIHIPVWDVDMDKIFDPQYNTWYAMNVIYPRQGFDAWVCNRLID